MPGELQNIQLITSERPMSPFHILMVAICFILNFCDGIDVLAVSYSSSEIIKEFNLSKAEMGYVFSCGLVGMALGCFFIAPLADKTGRRKILLLSLLLITIGMLLVSICNSYLLLLGLRFLTGLGIGGILPAMAVTASEFSNNKYRDFNVALVQAGWPVGAILTGFVCAYTIPHFGWKFIFLLAGCTSMAMLILVYFFMADSLDFLLKKQPVNALKDANNLLVKMKLSLLTSLPDKTSGLHKTSPAALFQTEYQNSTIKSWVAVFFGFLTLYTLMSWVPSIAKDMGLPPHMAIFAGVALNAGAAIGSASNGALGSKYGLRNTISLFMFSGFVIMLLYGNVKWPVAMLFSLIFFIGIFVQGGFNGLYPALTRIYPSHIRATGTGYAFGIGRIGAIIGPAWFGYLSDIGYSLSFLFTLFSIPLLISGIAVYNIKSPNLIIQKNNRVL